MEKENKSLNNRNRRARLHKKQNNYANNVHKNNKKTKKANTTKKQNDYKRDDSILKVDSHKMECENIEKKDLNDDIEDNFIEKEEQNNQRIIIDISSKKHIGFKVRLLILVFFLVISLILTSVSCYFYLTYKDKQDLLYNVKGIADYKIHLKDNDMNVNNITKEDLNKNEHIYFNDLIDKIDVNFNYDFDINQKSDIVFKYNIVAEIVIKDKDNKNILYTDKFNLVQNKNREIYDSKNININETINGLDFLYYQSIANSYSKQFDSDTNNYLNIYLDLHRENAKSENEFLLNDYDKIIIIIPLNEGTNLTNILNINEIKTKQRIDRISFINTKRDILCFIGIFLVLILYFGLKIFYLLKLLKKKKSEYEKYIERILNKYNKYIVESTTILDLKKFDVIKVKDFKELLDVYYNLELPIVYYEVNKGQKCYFYIKYNNDIYLLQVKAVDLERKN